jgi:hypothetical protein
MLVSWFSIYHGEEKENLQTCLFGCLFVAVFSGVQAFTVQTLAWYPLIYFDHPSHSCFKVLWYDPTSWFLFIAFNPKVTDPLIAYQSAPLPPNRLLHGCPPNRLPKGLCDPLIGD